MDELDAAIYALTTPVIDSATAQQRNRAIEWALAHADVAHARLLSELSGPAAPNAAGLADVLPLFGRVDSVSVLERLTATRDEHTAFVAAHALARHPAAAARAALERLLASERESAVIAAADALLARGERESCVSLMRAVTSESRLVRLHVLRAAALLGCISDGDLDALARDPDDGVREIVRRLRPQH